MTPRRSFLFGPPYTLPNVAGRCGRDDVRCGGTPTATVSDHHAACDISTTLAVAHPALASHTHISYSKLVLITRTFSAYSYNVYLYDIFAHHHHFWLEGAFFLALSRWPLMHTPFSIFIFE